MRAGAVAALRRVRAVCGRDRFALAELARLAVVDGAVLLGAVCAPQGSGAPFATMPQGEAAGALGDFA